VNVNYTYTASEIQQPSLITKSEESDVNLIWPISQHWSAIGRWNFGWDDNRTIEAFAGLEYNDCCWKTRLVWRRFLKDPRNVTQFVDDPTAPGGFTAVNDLKTPSDVGIFFEFQLKGLAMLGGRLDSLLEDAIPGYREREDIIGL
jgi:LPS-assembly protein